MKVYLVTDLKTKKKEWYVVKTYEILLEKLEKIYGQKTMKVQIDHITDDTAYFLKNQKSFDRTYIGGKK